MATTAGVHGPQTSPQTPVLLDVQVQFCCATRPGDTQRPWIDEDVGDAPPALAGAAGRARSPSSKFSTTRFNDTDDGAAFGSACGRAASFSPFGPPLPRRARGTAQCDETPVRRRRGG